jgi:type IX secretion system substrate protein
MAVLRNHVVNKANNLLKNITAPLVLISYTGFSMVICKTAPTWLSLRSCLKNPDMKRTNIILIGALLIGTFILSSYREGPATHGWDCTGGETGLGNAAGCAISGGCHGSAANTGIVVTLELDSAGVPVTSYKGGMAYTITIKGTNTTASSLPKYGFQLIAIQGATAEVTPVNEGTFQQTGLPAGVHYQTPVNATYLVANVIEHTTPLSPDSGTGGNGTIYKESIGWTAPVAGTGTVSFWGALNAVNDNGSADGGDLWNTQHLVITEDTVVHTVNSVADLNANLTVDIFPNPSTDFVQLEISNASWGSYGLYVYDSEGRLVLNRSLDVAGDLSKTSINTTGWSSGIYIVKVSNGGMEKVVKIVKR